MNCQYLIMLLSKRNSVFKGLRIFGILAIFLTSTLIFSFSERNPVKYNRIYSSESLNQLERRVKCPEVIKENEIVQKFFSWPVPQRPKTIDDVTDPKETSYVILKKDDVHKWSFSVGEELKIFITARNRRGERKPFGGDYFRVLLFSATSISGVMGVVIDHNDGTYTATIPLSFPGSLQLRVILIHPSEAIDLLRRITATKGSPGLIFRGIFQKEDVEEQTECNVWLPSMENATVRQLADGYCDFTHSELQQSWFCEKPTNLHCSDVKRYKVTRTNDATTILRKSKLFELNVNLRVQIGEIRSVLVTSLPNSIKFATPSLPVCNEHSTGFLPPQPGGYFLDGSWKSYHCMTKSFNPSTDKSATCLQNKVIHILGDSTIRQWYSYFIGVYPTLLNKVISFFKQSGVHAIEQKTFSDIWEPRVAVDYGSNITFHFSAHGPPLQNGGTPESQPYIADRIDRVQGGKDTVVAITIGPHFLLYEPGLFVRRLEGILRAVRRLKSRAPKTTVLFRGLNIFEMDDFSSNQCCLFDWLAYRLNTIARNMITRTKDVVFLDMWHLSGAHPSKPNGLHTPGEVLQNEINYFLSFVCPSS